MKTRVISIGLLLIAFHISATAATFMSGARFMDLTLPFDRGLQRTSSSSDQADGIQLAAYAMGVYDLGQGIFFCSPSSVSTTQLIAVARKYISDQPERWNERASTLIAESFAKAFPCEETK